MKTETNRDLVIHVFRVPGGFFIFQLHEFLIDLLFPISDTLLYDLN